MRAPYRCTLVLIVALALGAALGSAGAAASVRIGPDLTPVQTGLAYGCSPTYPSCTWVNLHGSNPAAPTASPVSGVITKWRFRAGCCTDPVSADQTLTLEVLKPGDHDGTFGYTWIAPPVRTGPTFVLPVGNVLPSDPATELPARVPIAAGESIGILASEAVEFASYALPSVSLTIIATGTTYAPYPGEEYGSTYGAALAIGAEVEPDADGDGFGDETQDCQPAAADQHEACAPAFTPSPPPNPISVGVSSGGSCSGSCGSSAVVFTRPPTSIPSPRGDGGIEVFLQCPPNVTAPCAGILYVELPPSKGGGKPRIAKVAAPKLLAKAGYSVAPGSHETLKVKFSKQVKAFLARKRSRKVLVSLKPADGGPATITAQNLHYPAAAPKR